MEDEEDELFDMEEPELSEEEACDFGLYEDENNYLYEEDEEQGDSRYVRPVKKPVKRHFVKYDNAKRLAASITMSEGERWDVIVSGNFIFGDFIEAFMVKNNCKAVRMDITTLSMSQNNVDSLRLLMEKGYVEALNLIVSHYFYAHELHALIPYIYRELDMEDRFQFAVATIHTKTAIIRTLGGKKIVIHGSANLRSCGNIEQFTIEEQPELYGFYERIDDSILKEHATIQKYSPKQRLSEIININNEP